MFSVKKIFFSLTIVFGLKRSVQGFQLLCLTMCSVIVKIYKSNYTCSIFFILLLKHWCPLQKKTDREAENYVRYKKFNRCMLTKCSRQNSELCRVLCFDSPLMVNGIGKTWNSNSVFVMNRHPGKGDVQLQGFPCHYLSGVFLKL